MPLMKLQTQSTVNALQWNIPVFQYPPVHMEALGCVVTMMLQIHILDPRDVKMLPNHLCPSSRGKTLRIAPAVVVMVRGGWASFMMTIVFSGFTGKPTRSNCSTNASKRLPASTRECARIRMSSAIRKSNKLGPSIKLKPFFSTSALHSRIAICNTA